MEPHIRTNTKVHADVIVIDRPLRKADNTGIGFEPSRPSPLVTESLSIVKIRQVHETR
jgi:hypothetical protein